MNPCVSIQINGRAVSVPSGCNVAAALALAGENSSRRSSSGAARAAFCGMGQCQECRVEIDGSPHRLACMTPVRAGMCIVSER